MKITPSLTQLAFIMLMLHIITRGSTTCLQIIGATLSPEVSYSILFIAELTYIMVILYLISVLFFTNNKPTGFAMIVYLVVGIAGFLMPFGYKTGLISPMHNNLYITAIPGILNIVVLVFMLAASFRINPPELGSQFRIFFIAIVVAAALRGFLPTLLISKVPSFSVKAISYFDLISLIPAFCIFFIIQKVSLILNNHKV